MITSPTELALYAEEYLLEEDEMTESLAHSQLIHYLVALLKFYFRLQGWLVAPDFELRHPAIANHWHKIGPDIALFKGIILSAEERQNMSSWEIRPGHPAPPLVIEVSSHSTWQNDIAGGTNDKPAIFGRIGVKEYIAYDPYQPRLWTGTNGRRLLGWRYNEQGQPQAIVPDQGEDPSVVHPPLGRLWSQELGCWLGEDGAYMRLYDRAGRQLLTADEAADAARITAEEQRAEEARARAEEARARAEEARARGVAEEKLAVETRARVELEEQLAELKRQLAAQLQQNPKD